MYPDLTRDDVFMIGTRRLWLRWPRVADAERLAVIGGHPDVAAMTATWPVACDAAYARDRIDRQRQRNASGTALTLVIAERSQWVRAVGLLGMAVADDGAAEATLGYHLDPDMWGRGYASEAVGALLDMTRLLTRIATVKAGVMPHNPVSMRVLEKNGFVSTGRSVFQSPLRGPVDVVDFARDLRRQRSVPPPRVRARAAQQAPQRAA